MPSLRNLALPSSLFALFFCPSHTHAPSFLHLRSCCLLWSLQPSVFALHSFHRLNALPSLILRFFSFDWLWQLSSYVLFLLRSLNSSYIPSCHYLHVSPTLVLLFLLYPTILCHLLCSSVTLSSWLSLTYVISHPHQSFTLIPSLPSLLQILAVL